MGWASGGELADKIERALGPHLDKLPADVVRKLGDDIATAFADMDCDVLDECEGFIGDAHNRSQHEDAPKNPKKDDTYVQSDRYAEKFKWNGRRWLYVE